VSLIWFAIGFVLGGAFGVVGGAILTFDRRTQERQP
jgi:hypothetical protein